MNKMPQCFVLNCGNYYGKTRGTSNVIYHMLPSSRSLCAKWLALCGYSATDEPPKHARVCSEHFSSKCYQRDLQHELMGLPLRKKLRNDAIPDRNLPNSLNTEIVGMNKTIGDVKTEICDQTSALKMNETKTSENVPKEMKNEVPKNENKPETKKNNRCNSKNDNSSTQNGDIVKQAKARKITINGINGNKQQVKCNKEKQDKNISKMKNTAPAKNSRSRLLPPNYFNVMHQMIDNVCLINIRNKINSNYKLPDLLPKANFPKEVPIKHNLKLPSSTVLTLVNPRADNALKTDTASSKNIEKISVRKSITIMRSQVTKDTFPLPKLETPSEINGKKIETPLSVLNFDCSGNENKSKKRKKEKTPPKADISNVKNGKINKTTRLPMRSSIRIAKKRSIESLSDSFTNKINKSGGVSDGLGNTITDKVRFMAKLELKLERKTDIIDPTELAVAKLTKNKNISLNKMRIMEDVKEGCDVQPSSPGHAEQRSDDQKLPKENHTENGLNPETVNQNGQHDGAKENVESNTDQAPKAEEMSPENEIDNEEKCEKNSDSNHVNEEAFSDTSSSENQSNKRKLDSEDGAIKKLRLDLQENFLSRDKILNEFMEISECSNVDQIQTLSEQILAEIKMLNDVAKEKEREWNNILHLKKLKEELLLRLQRRKQVLLVNDKSISDITWDIQNDSGNLKNNNFSQSILKTNLSNSQKPSSSKTAAAERNQNKFRNILPRPQTTIDMNGSIDYRSRQRPVLDVQSIIADYRQRHPETVPRRGRRIRNNNTSDSNSKSSNGVINFSSLALGSGAQVRQNMDVNTDLGLLLNALEGNRQDSSRSMTSDSGLLVGDANSFKDMLVHFARLSQTERNELIQNAIKPPPPYPEVTVHPVPTTTTSTASTTSNSLLHGILTKSPTKSNSKSSFSPTLARLLTAPERGSTGHTSTPITNTIVHPGNVSISEILATSKSRSEITITPVGSQYDATPKNRSTQMEEEEAEDSADRLVIDESSDTADARRGDNGSDAGDEVPQCQGCNQKQAQFVCAGCGNQWYCSRDCQVAAWDEHSEVCSG